MKTKEQRLDAIMNGQRHPTTTYAEHFLMDIDEDIDSGDAGVEDLLCIVDELLILVNKMNAEKKQGANK